MSLVLIVLYSALAQDAVVVQPLPRDHMTQITTSPPCGGVPKGKSHLLSQPGSLNKVSWKVLKPAPGNCTVKLIYGNEYTQQHTLLPHKDDEGSNGSFKCGENSGVFAKVFKFPSGVSCDSCTLQWIWVNSYGTFYHCIDIEITDLPDSSCYGRCKNGGFCSEGMCKCEPGFFGTFCELDGRSEPVHILVLFISIMVLLYFAVYLFIILCYRKAFTGKLILNKIYCFLPSLD
jgi:hypothetical protein